MGRGADTGGTQWMMHGTCCCKIDGKQSCLSWRPMCKVGGGQAGKRPRCVFYRCSCSWHCCQRHARGQPNVPGSCWHQASQQGQMAGPPSNIHPPVACIDERRAEELGPGRLAAHGLAHVVQVIVPGTDEQQCGPRYVAVVEGGL